MMPEGTIVGGWGYVTAAYAVTVVGLLVYAWRLVAGRFPSREEDTEV